MSTEYSSKSKIESQRLMNELLPLAEKMLAEHGEFFPYGGYLDAANEVVHVGAEGPSEGPSSRELLKTLIGHFQQLAANAKCRATAIVFDVRIARPGSQIKTDAIQASLEHIEGFCADVFFPYQLGNNGRIIYQDTFAQEGTHQIFIKPPADNSK